MIDPVRIQVGIRLKKNIPVSYEFLRAMVVRWASKEKLPKGIEIVYIRWINPERRHLGLAVWKDSRDPDQSLTGANSAQETLGRLLQTVRLEFVGVPADVKKKTVKVEPLHKRQPKTKPRRKVSKTEKAAKKKLYNLQRRKQTKETKKAIRVTRQRIRKLQHVRKNKGVRKTK